MKGKRQEVILQLIKEKIYLTQEDLQSELIRLGFVQIDNYYIDNIDNFFTLHKNCKK